MTLITKGFEMMPKRPRAPYPGQTWYQYEATRSTTTGSPISAMDDIGGSYDLTAAGGDRPTWTAAAANNGAEAITFDGANNIMRSTVGFQEDLTEYGYLLVNPDRGASTDGVMISRGLNGSADPRLTVGFLVATNEYQFKYIDDTGVTQIDLTVSASGSGWDLVVYKKEDPSDGAQLYVYGGDSAGQGAFSVTTSTYNRQALGAYAGAGIGEFCAFDFMAGLSYETPPSADQEHEIIQYLLSRFFI